MLKAIRNSSNFIAFKLVQNQDVSKFNMVENLAKALHGPIVASPAFSDVGQIPERLSFLFNRDQVFINTHTELFITKDALLLNKGDLDKSADPLSDVDRQYRPTARVLVMHPKTMTRNNPAGMYDIHRAYRMTSSTMSDPAYLDQAEYVSQLRTANDAQKAAEYNRGVTIFSRGYADPQISALVEGADGYAFRWAPYTKGSFGYPEGLFDQCKIYTENSMVQVKYLPALILPDLHWPTTSPAFLDALFRYLEYVGILKKNPRFGQMGELEYSVGDVKVGAMTIHDGPDGTPFNLHIYDKKIPLSKMDSRDLLNMETHYRDMAFVLNTLVKLFPDTKFVLPDDNHGQNWIARSIESGDLSKIYNLSDIPLVLKLMLETATHGGNPYQIMLEQFGVDTVNVEFMGKDSTYRIAFDPTHPDQFSLLNGVEIGQHGDKGTNGMKSISLKTMLKAYGPSVAGHKHLSEQNGNAVTVSAGTPPRQGYHVGPSTGGDWSIAFVFDEETVQLIRADRGSFFPNDPNQSPDLFFPDGFPQIIPKALSPEGGKTSGAQRKDHPGDRTRTSK